MLKKNDSVPGFVVDTPPILHCLQTDWPDRVHSTIALNRSCSHKIGKVQIYIGKTKRVLLLEILFTLFIHTLLLRKTAARRIPLKPPKSHSHGGNTTYTSHVIGGLTEKWKRGSGKRGTKFRGVFRISSYVAWSKGEGSRRSGWRTTTPHGPHQPSSTVGCKLRVAILVQVLRDFFKLLL